MTIPPAAVAVIASAIDDYRLTTPSDAATPAGQADRIAEYLLASGWTVQPQTEEEEQPRCTSTPSPPSHSSS